MTVTGAEGCPTNRYGTDGAIVAVLDYDGPPTAASLTVNERQAASNGFGGRPPYYLDLNTGRTLQFLGPIHDNGVYDIVVEWGYAGPSRSKISASFTLNRNCPNPH